MFLKYLLFFIFTFQLYALEIDPFLLPKNHPAKQMLDQIFSKKGVLSSRKKMEAAGFKTRTKKTMYGHLILARHPKLPGYFIKAYLNTTVLQHPPHTHWIRRIVGAQYVQKAIEDNHTEHLFKVPRKWLYFAASNLPLEENKDCILIEDNMRIVSNSENRKLWRTAITEEILDYLYEMVRDNGLDDSVRPANVWFSKDGKLSFVDTGHHHRWPIRYRSLNRFLSPSMCEYWKRISGQ